MAMGALTDSRQLAEFALSNPNGPPGVLELARGLLAALDQADKLEAVAKAAQEFADVADSNLRRHRLREALAELNRKLGEED